MVGNLIHVSQGCYRNTRKLRRTGSYGMLGFCFKFDNIICCFWSSTSSGVFSTWGSATSFIEPCELTGSSLDDVLPTELQLCDRHVPWLSSWPDWVLSLRMVGSSSLWHKQSGSTPASMSPVSEDSSLCTTGAGIWGCCVSGGPAGLSRFSPDWKRLEVYISMLRSCLHWVCAEWWIHQR